MKSLKTPLLLTLLLFIFSCKSSLVNYAMEKKGIYEEKVTLKKISYKNKNIVFIPMKHIATQKFYNNVGIKTDSLLMKDYHFYLEKIDYKDIQNTDLLKFRKVLGIAIPIGGYSSHLEKLKQSVKLKKEMVLQPAYDKWQLNDSNSKIVDLKIVDLIKKYEKDYSEIKLEPCDLEEPDAKKESKCQNKTQNKIFFEKIIIGYRNENIAKHIIKDTGIQNICIIYGAEHYEGIKKKLDSLQTF